MKYLLLLFSFLLLAKQSEAADSLVAKHTRPIIARFITTDNLGNTYAVNEDNTVVRFNENGDSTGFYGSTLNGAIGSIDATNPQKLLLYYPTFSKVVLLDRQLSLQTELDLRKQNIFTPTAVATASDGRLWVYDPVNARLLKLDENVQPIVQGTDLRQQLSFVPKATFLLERDRRLYLCDTAQGILVFDQFGTFINTLPFKGIAKIQAFDQQLVFLKNGQLHSYNLQTGMEQIQILSKAEEVVDACIRQKGLVILYEGWLGFY